jgi:hypothetical protein
LNQIPYEPESGINKYKEVEMKQEHIRKFFCPKCSKEFRHGLEDRFGPPRIKCGNCGEILVTGLTEWAKLSLWEKVYRGVLELINPYHTGNIIYFAIYHTVAFFIISIPLGFLMINLGLQPSGLSLEELKNWKEVAPFMIGGTIYVAILIGQLIMKIIKTQEYTNSGTPPTWTTLR